jgi:tripartite-type tricarboxylate transporter receptor subunit TctC
VSALAVGVIATLLSASQSPAQVADGKAIDYPQRAVQIIVPFAPGGPTDVTARLIAQKLTQNLGQNFVVENQPGAGGNRGLRNLLRAEPDGYTFAFISTGFFVNPSLFTSLPFDTLKDFAGITLAGTSPSALIVHPSVPAKTVKELIELMKIEPGKYSIGHAGPGTSQHLSAEMLRLAGKLENTLVPFSGSSPVITSVLGGHTPVGFAVMTPAVGPIKEGKLRALALTSEERSSALPDIPTIVEAGFPDQVALTLQGIVIHSATPKPIVEFLNRELRKAFAEPDIRSKLIEIGYSPVTTTTEEFAARAKSEIDRWAKLIKDANITPVN